MSGSPCAQEIDIQRILSPEDFNSVFPQGTDHVHVVENISLTLSERNLLLHGLNFIPLQNTPTYKEDFNDETQDYFNRLRWKDYFSRHPSKPLPPLYVKQKHIKIRPPDKDLSIELITYICHTSRELNTISHTLDNTDHQRFFDWTGFWKLQNKLQIIKPTDKNLGTCIIFINKYNKEVLKQLNNTKYY